MATKVTVYTHPDCILHETRPHVECPERLMTVMKAIEDQLPDINRVHTTPATDDHIRLVHDEDYLEWLKSMEPFDGMVVVDGGDTMMSPKSLDAAYLAAGAVVQATKDVIVGKVTRAFCAIRPPGHHAEPDQAMGFCFFNNVAIGAKVALDQLGLKRVAIVDFDVHHGNGTETIAKKDPRILFISSHHWGIYPGSGGRDSPPNVINLNLPRSTDGKALMRAYEERALPALDDFKPELILISAGFDGHKNDPIGGWLLETPDFFTLTKELVKVANKYAYGRVISTLEGGYDLEALAESVVAHIKGLECL